MSVGLSQGKPDCPSRSRQKHRPVGAASCREQRGTMHCRIPRPAAPSRSGDLTGPRAVESPLRAAQSELPGFDRSWPPPAGATAQPEVASCI
jgi:hypothetical protein